MKPFVMAQLSDLHLSGQVGFDPSYQKFLCCLEAAKHQAQFLLLTGDLVNDGSTAGYDWLFATLDATRLDYACLAGNHDVTMVKNPHLPYHARQFLPIAMDARLVKRKCLTVGAWRLLCLNSAKAGCDYGEIVPEDLAWLSKQLATPTPTLIALHHPPIKVGSAWIDTLKLSNAEDLFTVLQQSKHAQALVCGHVHQACEHWHNDLKILTCPAVSRQFLPHSDEFAIDNRPSGFRLIELDTTLKTQVFRI